MPLPNYEVPAQHVVDDEGHVPDHNSMAHALAAIGGINIMNTAYGTADNTGATACDSVFSAAIATLPNSGGLIFVPPGIYKLSSGAVVHMTSSTTGPVQFFLSPGARINYYGSGDCIRMYSDVDGSSGNPTGWRSGILGDGVIDGSNCTAGASGAHLGDIPGLQVHCTIQNFGGTGSKGLWFDNVYSWTEEIDARAVLLNNTTNVTFEITTGYPSFAYSRFDFTIITGAGTDGVHLKNGANLYSCLNLTIRGNFATSGTTFTSYVFKMSGQTPVGSKQPGGLCIFRGSIDIVCETGGGLTYKHGSIWMDTGANAATFSASGRMWFLGFNGSNSPAQIAVNGYWFDGTVNAPGGSSYGDVALQALQCRMAASKASAQTVSPTAATAVTQMAADASNACGYRLRILCPVTVSGTTGTLTLTLTGPSISATYTGLNVRIHNGGTPGTPVTYMNFGVSSGTLIPATNLSTLFPNSGNTYLLEIDGTVWFTSNAKAQLTAQISSGGSNVTFGVGSLFELTRASQY